MTIRPAPPDLRAAARMLSEGVDRLWRSEAGGAMSAPSVGVDGTVLTGAFDHRVYGIDPADGRTRWSHKTDSHLDGPPVQGPDGRLYATSRDLNLHILSPQGRFLNKVYAGPTTCGPAIDGQGRVYVGLIDGQLKAFDPDGGSRWTWKSPNEQEAGFMVSPVVGPDGTVYAAAGGGTVVALDPESGQPKWTVKPGGAFYAPFSVGADGRVLLSSLSGTVHALDPQDGHTLWSAPTGAALHSAPLGLAGLVVVGNDSGRLVGLRADDGSEAWSQQLSGKLEASPVLTPGGVLLTGDGKSNLLALDPSTGDEQWRIGVEGVPGAGALSPDGSVLYLRIGREGVAALPTRARAERVAEPLPPAGEIVQAEDHVDVGEIRLPTRGCSQEGNPRVLPLD